MTAWTLDPDHPTVAYLTDADGQRTGPVLRNVHSPNGCFGRPCIIHAPSDHHMRDWPIIWRDDRGITERACAHGVGHPDPDQRPGDMIHGCDGCCVAPDAAEGGTL